MGNWLQTNWTSSKKAHYWYRESGSVSMMISQCGIYQKSSNLFDAITMNSDLKPKCKRCLASAPK